MKCNIYTIFMITKPSFVIVSLLSLFLVSACVNNATTTSQYNSNATDKSTTMTEPPKTDETSKIPQLASPVAGEKIVAMETDLGTIKFKLFSEHAPEMVKNFEELAKAGKYNNVPFHRVMKNFMIQTGDFTNKNGTGGYSYKGPETMLEDEIDPSLKHFYGTVSMANRGPDTNGSQFFIVTNKTGTSWLNGIHSIFGQVYEGMDVAEKIADLQVPNNQAGTPGKIINIKKITVSTYSAE